MTNDLITDNELDALLAAPSKPILDNGFTEEMLTKIMQREKLIRYIPLTMGIFGAAITSFFMPTEIFNSLLLGAGTVEQIKEVAQNPIFLAMLLCLPIVGAQLSYNES